MVGLGGLRVCEVGMLFGLTSVGWRWLRRFKGVAVGRVVDVRGYWKALFDG